MSAAEPLLSQSSPNGLLSRLPGPVLEALAPRLRRHQLPVGQVLHGPGDTAQVVWFSLGSMLSQIASGSEGETVETAAVGLEGALGLTEALASGRLYNQAVVQVDGEALSMPAAEARRLAATETAFAEMAWISAEMQALEARQSSLCQAHHPVEHRLARWLGETFDRTGNRTVLPLTQEYIAAMMGVQRTTVNAFATQLQKAGLIRYSRGRVTICDVEGLDGRACECRSVLREHRDRLGIATFRERGRSAGDLSLTSQGINT